MSKKRKHDNRWDAFTTAELRQLTTGDIGPALDEELAGEFEARIETLAGASPVPVVIGHTAAGDQITYRAPLPPVPATDFDRLGAALEDLGRTIIRDLRLVELSAWLARKVERR